MNWIDIMSWLDVTQEIDLERTPFHTIEYPMTCAELQAAIDALLKHFSGLPIMEANSVGATNKTLADCLAKMVSVQAKRSEVAIIVDHPGDTPNARVEPLAAPTQKVTK